MKNYQAILFDLDGTLLHMPQDPFLEGLYAAESAEIAPKLGMDHETFVKMLNTGVYLMVKNTGACTNEEAFLNYALPLFQSGKEDSIKAFDDYYEGNFHKLKDIATQNLLAAKAVALAKEKAGKVILATNPIFPMSAQRARLSWIGLTPEDFDLVTFYGNSCYCKPNPDYYSEILKKFDLQPQDCLMVGNDVKEDMRCASSIGMDVYLVTDCLIDHGLDATPYRKGTFADFVDDLKNERI